jgi:hypothetical protein
MGKSVAAQHGQVAEHGLAVPNQSNFCWASFQSCWWLFAFGCCMTKEDAGP